MTFEKLASIAMSETTRAIAELPPQVSAAVKPIPIFFEAEPSGGDIDSGLDPDLLGLYDPGPGDGSTPRIRLWLANLWDFADAEEEAFREEVRITLLHEIGHAIGWDEQDLEDRGLG